MHTSSAPKGRLYNAKLRKKSYYTTKREKANNIQVPAKRLFISINDQVCLFVL